MALVFSLLAVGPVRADLEITAQQDAGPVTVIVDDPVDFDVSGSSFNGTFGDFRFSAHAVSSNASAVSDISLTASILNVGTTTQTLTLQISQDNFTLPSPPSETLKSAIGGALPLSVAGDTISLNAYANNSNGLFDTVGATSSGLQSFTSPGGAAISFNSSSPVVPFNSSLPYSLTTIATITLAPGSSVNLGADPVVTPVPEPAELSLLLLGGLLALVRQRADL